MSPAQKIIQELEALSPALQEEALDFIEYLKLKKNRISDEVKEWNALSLKTALRGMEDDVFPEYEKSDLKEIWK